MARDSQVGEDHRARRGARRGERLLALTAAGVLALNYPIAALFSGPATLLGIPGMVVYLFGVWAALIGLAAWIIEGRARRAGGGRRGPGA